MKTIMIAALALAGFGSANISDPAGGAIDRGAQWLVSVQGSDGGWGQDGGATSHMRQSERLVSTGNDVANTAVAGLALLKAGHHPARGLHGASVRKAVEFVLQSVEASPAQGIQVTSITGTQIQGKLGPFIDTFLAAQFLAEVDGLMPDTARNARVRTALRKCISKIESNQQKDGSWNTSGAWAPILSTSMASRGLNAAKSRGYQVNESVLARVETYTKNTSGPAGSAGGRGRVADAAAGVDLYKRAQELEQFSRDEKARRENARGIQHVVSELRNDRFVAGFGSMGGEEFFSYLNISDSLHRMGGEEWRKWNGDIKTKLVKLQNQDGSWAGHHCITGRVAVTGAAMLTMLVDRTQARK